MILWITGAISANNITSIAGISNKRALAVPFEVNGLNPNAFYTFWVNNTNMTWACRQYGTKLGDGLRSDNGGYLSFEFHTEILQVPIQNDMTKYYNYELRDIDDRITAVSITQQSLKKRN